MEYTASVLNGKGELGDINMEGCVWVRSKKEGYFGVLFVLPVCLSISARLIRTHLGLRETLLIYLFHTHSHRDTWSSYIQNTHVLKIEVQTGKIKGKEGRSDRCLPPHHGTKIILYVP